ncbi:MAG: minichromosome maintenance protein MCM [Candidatus Bathyarchaeota archaeon]|nr:minichromosome maintenance protein MCM [Candidatus Bathyarchaeum tardum]WGM89010.1 MAG: minichromosome maintenance protein MCM [Candidatus Bathyarchaeum tardum]
MTEETITIDPEAIFLDFFKMDKYRERISSMAVSGNTSFVVDFDELLASEPKLAQLLMDKPDEYLEYANRAAKAQLQIEEQEYAEETKTITVRFKGLPEATPLRILGSKHIGKFVMLEGIVVRASPARPMVMEAAFKCKWCGAMAFVTQSGPFLTAPNACSAPECRRKSAFDFVQEESTFIDSQDVRIQERPEDLPPGQLPRWLDIKLLERDLVDAARPGDHIAVVGITRAHATRLPKVGQLRSFTLQLDTNYIDVESKEPEKILITPEEEEQILELSKDPEVHNKILQSLAPSIYGNEHLKEAVMYLLFGGTAKHFPDITIRGDMNVLIVGDPGTAKSQLLQYVSKIAPRGLYTSGRGTTAAGLTAAVLRDKTGGMTLEAGALVLADKGVAAIDEMDKMRTEDRVAIHEVMEQHTVSIAKGGIVATLNARTSVLAAANPTLGRYDPYRTVSENISLPVTILSRFDLIFVLRDVPEEEKDARTTEHILDLHRRGTIPTEAPINSELFRKYVSYSKNMHPTLSQEALDCLKDFYLRMRAASETEGTPVAITARQLESLVRVAEARARIALKDKVELEDAEHAIEIMKISLEQVGIDISSQKFDIDIIMTGKPKSLRDKLSIILGLITTMEKETGMVDKERLMERLQTEYDVLSGEAERMINQMLKEGTLFEPKNGFLKKT